MTEPEIIAALEENIDGIEEGTLSPVTPLAECAQWDSLAVLTVIAMADADYGVELSGSELRECSTPRDICNLILLKHSS